MSLLLPLLRACEANAASRALRSTLHQSSVRCCGQSTFWQDSNVQDPGLQLQQLHSAAAAALAAVTAPAAAEGASGSSGTAAPPQGATGQLQRVQADGMLTSLLTGLGSVQMGVDQIGLYYDINKALLPEAFQAFHQAFYTPRPTRQQRKGGCRSLQAELALTHSSSLMWRRATHELAQTLSSSSSSSGSSSVGGVVGPRLHLTGAPGSGKSIAVAQMVVWARSKGWIALYIPSATDLTRGGFFYQRPGSSHTYDTIICAQYILKSMGDSHAAQLAQLPLQLETSQQLLKSQPAAAGGAGGSAAGGAAGSSAVVERGGQAAAAAPAAPEEEGRKRGKKGAAAAGAEGSLMQLVVAGLSTDEDAELAVECVLALIAELAAVSKQQPVLLAVDDYNALYWTTEYGRTLFKTPDDGAAYSFRKPLEVKQLNLARNLRLLERQDLGSCRVLVADSASNRVPADLTVPSGGAAVYHMPRFSQVETAHALFYYHERGLTAEAPSARQVAAMRALTNGSGTDLRRWCLKVTQTDMGLL